jgi:hypothetical protein
MLTDGTAVVKGLGMDELVITVIKEVILSGVLNSFSSRFFFFLDSAFLGFFDRSVKVL